MGKNRDKHATAEDIEAATRQHYLQSEVNIKIWASVLTAAHKHEGHKITKRFATTVLERVKASLPPPDAFGYWAVHYENASFGASVSVYFVASCAETLGFPQYNNKLSFRIGNQRQYTNHYPRQDTIDVDYIKANNPWACAEHEKAALAYAALEQHKPREWADKIKAIDEAKKALLADAGAFRLQYLLDV